MRAGCGHLLARRGAPCPKCGVVWTIGGSVVGLSPMPETVPSTTSSQTTSNHASSSFSNQQPPKKKDYREEALAWSCRKSFSRFVKQAWDKLGHLSGTKLEWNWHHDALCLHLQTMAEEWAVAKEDPANSQQRIRNLLISIAPGTSKTLISLVFFPCWMWTRWPKWSARCVSANPRAIQDSSRFARDLVNSDWYRTWFISENGEEDWARFYNLEPWKLRDDQDAMSDWGNTAGGMRRSTGIKAPITGEHTDWLLCDDASDAQLVNSAEERATTISKWDNAIFNRVNDARIACRVIVGQRLHQDDLIGHILATARDQWCHLPIPSEFEPSQRAESPIGWQDPRTEVGELLDKVRFPRRVLDQELARLGHRGYAAQHQQRPEADSAVGFKVEWWNWWIREGQARAPGWVRPEGSRQDPTDVVANIRSDGSLDVDWVCISVDPSGGSIEEGASSVGILVIGGRKEKRYILEDLTPGPRTFLQQVDDVKNAVTRAVRFTGKRVIRVLVEKKAYGGAALEVMDKAVRSGDFATVDGRPVVLHFEPYDVKASMGSKEQRALGLEPDLFSGVIYLPEGASWLTPFLAEFRRFPATPNDRVDALVQVIERYRKKITWAQAFNKVGR